MSEQEQDTESLVDSEAAEQVLHWPSPGQKLMVIREELGLSHTRVADALHITAHYVKALETDEYDKLPGKTFIKGYLRAYAKLLGADVDEIMSCFDQYIVALEESVKSEENVIRAKKAYDQNLRWMICAAVIIIIVVGLSWWWSKKDTTTAAVSNQEQAALAQLSESASDNSAASVSGRLSTGEPVQRVAATVADMDGEVASALSTGAPDTDVKSNQPVTAEVLIASIEASTSVADQEANKDTVLAAQAIEGQEKELDEPGNNTRSAELASSINATSVKLDKTLSQADTGQTLTADSSARTASDAVGQIISSVDDHREIHLESAGNDLLEIHLKGDSWVEIEEMAGDRNAENVPLYQDMLKLGDELTIKGMAPFNVLIGDANVVEMTFNASDVDLTSRMRTDNSARIILQQDKR